EWTVHHPSAAAPGPAIPCAPAANRRSTTHPVDGDHAGKAPDTVLCPCLSHKAQHNSRQVPSSITYLRSHCTSRNTHRELATRYGERGNSRGAALRAESRARFDQRSLVL